MGIVRVAFAFESGVACGAQCRVGLGIRVEFGFVLGNVLHVWVLLEHARVLNGSTAWVVVVVVVVLLLAGLHVRLRLRLRLRVLQAVEAGSTAGINTVVLLLLVVVHLLLLLLLLLWRCVEGALLVRDGVLQRHWTGTC